MSTIATTAPEASRSAPPSPGPVRRTRGTTSDLHRSERRWAAVFIAPLTIGFVLFAVLPLLFGGTIFQTVTPVLHVPLLGEVHLPSALLFDVGVYLVVLGVILDFLRTLGAQIDQQQEAESDVR